MSQSFKFRQKKRTSELYHVDVAVVVAVVVVVVVAVVAVVASVAAIAVSVVY